MRIHHWVLPVVVAMSLGTGASTMQDESASAPIAGGEQRMLGTAKLMAFVATSDAARSKAFYEKTVGLRLVADEPFALVFDANGTQLRIQKVQKTQPLPFTVLGWEVANIQETVRALRQRGVAFERYSFMQQDDSGVWTADDQTKVAWFKDPDGNLLSLTQFKK